MGRLDIFMLFAGLTTQQSASQPLYSLVCLFKAAPDQPLTGRLQGKVVPGSECSVLTPATRCCPRTRDMAPAPSSTGQATSVSGNQCDDPCTGFDSTGADADRQAQGMEFRCPVTRCNKW